MDEEILQESESQSAAFKETNTDRDDTRNDDLKQESDDSQLDRSKATKDPTPARSTSSESLVHENVACRQSKLKLLVRSHAIREAASPPPDPLQGLMDRISKSSDAGRPSSKLEGQTNEKNDRVATLENNGSHFEVNRSASVSSTETCLAGCASYHTAGSVTSDETYTDNTGIDLNQFIVETLHRNQKDRTTLLRIEQEMVNLVRDPKRTCHRFPPMSSYHRMLVHRVAAFFGLEHNVDQSGNSVVVSKSSRTRLPEVAFKQYVREDVVLPEEPTRKFNLKREVFSFDESARNNEYRGFASGAGLRASQSFDQNFDPPVRAQPSKQNGHQSQWNSGTGVESGAVLLPSIQCASGYPDKSQYTCRCCLATCLNTNGEQHATCRHHHNPGILRVQRIQKVESLDATELRSSHQRAFRPAVAKSYSFGGYGTSGYGVPDFAENPTEGLLNVGNPPQRLQGVRNQSSFNCRLSKQDSNSSSVSISRSSPTSSGYKSQQSQSVSAAPSPTPLGQNRLHSRQPSNSWNNSIESQNSGPELLVPNDPVHCPAGSLGDGAPVSSLLWAVTSLDAVPPGSILINPQTGQPFYNPDGSVYRYDPQYALPSHVETVICTQQSEDARAQTNRLGMPGMSDFTGHQREEGERGELVNHAPWPYNTDNSMPQLPNALPNFDQRTLNNQSAQPLPAAFPAANFFESNTPFPSVMDERRGIDCIAIPQGHGYYLYQTAGSGTIDPSPVHLNCMMKNLHVRPVGEHLASANDSRSRETTANMSALTSRPGFSLQTSLPAGSYSVPSGPGALVASGGSPINSNACLSSIHVPAGHAGAAPYPPGNQYHTANYPPVVYSVPPSAVHSHHGCSQYVLNSYAQQYSSSQFLSSAFPVIVTPHANAHSENLDRDMTNKGNAQACGVLSGSYLPLGYRPANDSAMIVPNGEMQEPRTINYGIQRQFSLQSTTSSVPCGLSGGSQPLNPARPSHRHNRTPGMSTPQDNLSSRAPKRGRSGVQQHLVKQASEKSQNLSG